MHQEMDYYVENHDRQQHAQPESNAVHFQKREHGIAVANRENSLRTVTQSPAEENREDEGAPGILENAFGENEGLERNGRGKNGGKKRAEESVFLDPLLDGFGFAASVPVKESFATFFGEGVEHDAAAQRAERSHGRVVGHARGVRNAKLDQHGVREKWKGKDGGVEKGDDEEAATAKGENQALQPREYFFAVHWRE